MSHSDAKTNVSHWLLTIFTDFKQTTMSHTIFMWPQTDKLYIHTVTWPPPKHMEWTSMPSTNSQLSVNICKYVLTLNVRLVFGLTLPHFSHRAPSLLLWPVPTASPYWTEPSEWARGGSLHKMTSPTQCILFIRIACRGRGNRLTERGVEKGEV